MIIYICVYSFFMFIGFCLGNIFQIYIREREEKKEERKNQR